MKKQRGMESSSAAQIIEGVISYDSYGRRKDVTLITLMWHGFCIDVTACDSQVFIIEDTPMRPVKTKDSFPTQPIDMRRSGLVWHVGQNLEMHDCDCFLWKLPYCEWVTQTHLIIITLFQRHMPEIITESSGSKRFQYLIRFRSIWGGKPVENMLAYRKFLQVLELFNNVLKTPEELQSYCKWIVYKCQVDKLRRR